MRRTDSIGEDEGSDAGDDDSADRSSSINGADIERSQLGVREEDGAGGAGDNSNPHADVAEVANDVQYVLKIQTLS